MEAAQWKNALTLFWHGTPLHHVFLDCSMTWGLVVLGGHLVNIGGGYW